MTSDERTLPIPFGPEAWPSALAQAAGALWDWHLGLAESAVELDAGEAWVALVERERQRVTDGAPTVLLPEAISEAAYGACFDHDLPTALLAEQVGALEPLRGRVRFETGAVLRAFVQRFAGAHARLLAHLAGHTGTWQQPPTEALAFAFFLTGHLAHLPRDLARDRLFVPLEALEQAGVSEDMLRTGPAQYPHSALPAYRLEYGGYLVDGKIYRREVQRLSLSLAAARDRFAFLIAMLHYPPLYRGLPETDFVPLMREAGVDACVYGHLHGGDHDYAVQGLVDGIRYYFVAADAIGFRPVPIDTSVS